MIKLDLTIEEVNLVLAGLQELPAKLSMQLILKLQVEGQKQFDEQNKPIEKVVEKEIKKV